MLKPEQMSPAQATLPELESKTKLETRSVEGKLSPEITKLGCISDCVGLIAIAPDRSDWLEGMQWGSLVTGW